MKHFLLAALLLAALMSFSACRFVVVESGSVHIEAPTPSPTATLVED